MKMMHLNWMARSSAGPAAETEHTARYRCVASSDCDTIVRAATGQTLEEARAAMAAYLADPGLSFAGVGLEIQATCGVYAGLAAEAPGVRKIYAVESDPEAVRLLMPRLLGQIAHKVIPVLGMPDQLHLADESVDFVLTGRPVPGSAREELIRVLRPEGFLLTVSEASVWRKPAPRGAVASFSPQTAAVA